MQRSRASAPTSTRPGGWWRARGCSSRRSFGTTWSPRICRRRTCAWGTGSRGSAWCSSWGSCSRRDAGTSRGPRLRPLSPDRRRTLVILPTYDERDTIEWVVARFLALPEHVDILVVDDASPDGTGALVQAIADRRATRPAHGAPDEVGAVERVPRRASGPASPAATTSSWRWTRTSRTAPEELPALLADTARDRDLTIGSRYVPGGSVTDWSRPRVALSRAGNRYARFMLGLPIARRHERLPRLPTRSRRSISSTCRCTPTATASRSSSRGAHGTPGTRSARRRSRSASANTAIPSSRGGSWSRRSGS